MTCEGAADAGLFLGGTIRGRFIAVISSDNETWAQRLQGFSDGPEDLREQREEAWSLLSNGVRWAAQALHAVGIADTDDSPIRDSDAAFARAQHLDEQLFKLGQCGRHDREALLVDAVKQACYHGADLGPLRGGRVGSLRTPANEPRVVTAIEPHQNDLLQLGQALGDALLRYAELELGDPVEAALAALPVAA